MSRKFLPAYLLGAALAAGGIAAPVQAGHMSQSAHGQMSDFMAHHGFMKPSAREDKSSPARLGVAIAAIPQADLDSLDLEYGVRIQEVLDGSIAQDAGLQAGDVVTGISDRPAYSPERLQHLVGEAAGTSTIALMRDGESLQLTAAFPKPETGRAVLGVRIQEMTDELKEAFGTEGDAGVLISQVVPGSAAKQAGLKAGDVIVSMGGSGITTVDDVYNALEGRSKGDSLDIAIVREREMSELEVALGGAPLEHSSQAKHPHGTTGHGMPGHGGYGHGFHGSHGMMPKHGCGMGRGQRSS